jgi:hypothetical protein
MATLECMLSNFVLTSGIWDIQVKWSFSSEARDSYVFTTLCDHVVGKGPGMYERYIAGVLLPLA